jgi:hypothetical protein
VTVARRERSIARQLERELRRYTRRQPARAGTVRATSDDVEVVARTFAIDPDWRRHEDGRAARLGPRETIDLPVPETGPFAGRDPRTVVVGWRSVGRVLGLVGWGGAVGAGWWLGTRGHGPLSHLDRERTPGRD